MRNANCRKSIIEQRLEKMQLTERDRHLARHALRDAEAIVHAVIWVKERFASLGGVLLKPVFKH